MSSPGCTLTSADAGFISRKQDRASLYLFLLFWEILCDSSKQRSILWNSLILLMEISVSSGGRSKDIDNAAETANKQCLLLIKL